MRTAVSILATLMALSACGQAPHEDHVSAGNAAAPKAAAPAGPVVRLPAVPGRPAAGYFDYRVAGDRGALLSVSSPQAGRIEMHETMNVGGMSEMRPIARIPVRNGDMLSFTPGGRHLMLFELAPTVRPGGRIQLVLHFERGEPRTLAFPVEAAGEARGGD